MIKAIADLNFYTSQETSILNIGLGITILNMLNEKQFYLHFYELLKCFLTTLKRPMKLNLNSACIILIFIRIKRLLKAYKND